MQEINAWLQGGQIFTDGVQLYDRYGKSNFLKTLFANGPTPYNIEKLAAELIALAPTPPAIVEVKSEIEKPKDKVEEVENIVKKQVSNPENHKIYLAFLEQQKTLYRQLERNMVELDLQKSESILFATAKQILHLHKKITGNYFLIDYFDEHGYFPHQEVKAALKTDAMQLLQQSISKAKRRLKSGKCRDAQQTNDLIAEQTKKLMELQAERYNR
jgi:hypothetical protein